MESRTVIYFDGECNLCNGWVKFVIRHDRKKRFYFSALQSAEGAKAKEAAGIAAPEKGSVILYQNSKYYIRSAAALHIIRSLGFPWVLAGAFFIVPGPARDLVYDFIARNRYKWFGRQDTCMTPKPEYASRFI